MAGDDEVCAVLAAEHRQPRSRAPMLMGGRDADVRVVERRRLGELLDDGGVVAVAGDAAELGADVTERIEHCFGREVAEVEHDVGVIDGLLGGADECSSLGRVGVGEDDKHVHCSDGSLQKPHGLFGLRPGISPPAIAKGLPPVGRHMAGSTGVVLAALFANGAIAVLKFVGFLLTGSPSMLSETLHSVSDTGNQVFLLVGIRYSKKEASRGHPFGYGKAQFFYAFLVSVLLFGIAGWESLKQGYEAIQHAGHSAAGTFTAPVIGGSYETFWLNVVILAGAIAFESYAFVKARTEIRSQMEAFGWSTIPEAFRRTSDVTTLTAYTEDAIALGGAVIALVGITLTRITGESIYDAIAAALIGLLLMGFAIALAWENKRLLLGESLPREAEQALRTSIADHPGVTHVDSFRSVFFGPQRALVAADVSFDPELVTGDIDEAIAAIEATLREADSRVELVYIEPEL